MIDLKFNSLFLSILLLLFSLILLAAPADAAIYEVKMGSDRGELKFVPEDLEIKLGDTVE
ncbi:hypothetical protein [Myxosarcina sp. GI1(2024)]